MNYLDMSESQRKSATSSCYKILRRLGDVQIELLNRMEQNPYTLLSKHHFVSYMVKSFWVDFDFAYSLRNTKYDSYAVYPIRTIMEKMLKMVQFNKLSLEEQNDVVTKKLLLSMKRSYDMGQKDTSLYDQTNSENKFPPVDRVADKDLKAFESYEHLCNNFKNKKNLYIFYRWLSGIPHGNLAHLMFKRVLADTEYRRVVMMGLNFAYEMLLASDAYFNRIHWGEINVAWKQTQKIMGIDPGNLEPI